MAEFQQEAQSVQADAYQDRIILGTKEQGQEILYLSRSTAEQECNEMKQHANLESQRIMAEAELVKSAAQRELESQRMYAEAASLETESLEVLAQVRTNLADPTAFLGNGAKLQNHTVQLNAAWENEEPGKPPVLAVEPNTVESKSAAKKPSTTTRSRRSSGRAKYPG